MVESNTSMFINPKWLQKGQIIITEGLDRNLIELQYYQQLKNLKIEIENLECPVCYMVLWEPKTCGNCSKNFCNPCLESLKIHSQIKQEQTKCPNCRAILQIKKCDPIVQNMLSYLIFACPFYNKGCPEKIKHKNFQIHLNQCQFRFLKDCQFSDIRIQKYEMVKDGILSWSEPQFTIQWIQNGKNQTKDRRYIEFQSLHNYLVQNDEYFGLIIPQFPSNNALNQFFYNEQNNQLLRDNLEIYLNIIIENLIFQNDIILEKFFTQKYIFTIDVKKQEQIPSDLKDMMKINYYYYWDYLKSSIFELEEVKNLNLEKEILKIYENQISLQKNLEKLIEYQSKISENLQKHQQAINTQSLHTSVISKVQNTHNNQIHEISQYGLKFKVMNTKIKSLLMNIQGFKNLMNSFCELCIDLRTKKQLNDELDQQKRLQYNIEKQIQNSTQKLSKFEQKILSEIKNLEQNSSLYVNQINQIFL